MKQSDYSSSVPSSSAGRSTSSRRSSSRALYSANILIRPRSGGKKNSYDYVPFFIEGPTKKVPTGFLGVSPSAPAAPEMDTTPEE